VAQPVRVTLALVVWYRLLKPIINTYRFNMKVSEVIQEGPGVVSMRISGRNLDRLGTKAGQFYFWRFFAKGFWYTQHPYSLSEAPKGDSFRITVKNLGDHSGKFGQIPIGTRVFAEGPFGVFTNDSRTQPKALLIAGGIGITPVRALLEKMDGDLVALYRVVSDDDIVFRDELDAIASSRGAKVKLRGRRPLDGGGQEPALAETPQGARPGHRRAGRVSLRARGDDRLDRS